MKRNKTIIKKYDKEANDHEWANIFAGNYEDKIEQSVAKTNEALAEITMHESELLAGEQGKDQLESTKQFTLRLQKELGYLKKAYRDLQEAMIDSNDDHLSESIAYLEKLLITMNASRSWEVDTGAFKERVTILFRTILGIEPLKRFQENFSQAPAFLWHELINSYEEKKEKQEYFKQMSQDERQKYDDIIKGLKFVLKSGQPGELEICEASDNDMSRAVEQRVHSVVDKIYRGEFIIDHQRDATLSAAHKEHKE